MLNLLMPALDRTGYALVVDERFAGPDLDERLWLPHHLPHWSSRTASAARYRIDGQGHGLELLIEADQPPWYPDGDGWTRVSTLQTGEYAGELGSATGQHRFRPGLRVRESQSNVALLTPSHGLIECRARAIADPANMVALWLIGYEDMPERSAEICLFEIFGRHVTSDGARVGMGVHPHGDPAIQDDFERVALIFDATQPHDYAARWTHHTISFYVDEREVKVVRQSVDYPMQLMLSVFEFVEGPRLGSPPDAYPKVFGVEWLRVWRDTSGL